VGVAGVVVAAEDARFGGSSAEIGGAFSTVVAEMAAADRDVLHRIPFAAAGGELSVIVAGMAGPREDVRFPSLPSWESLTFFGKVRSMYALGRCIYVADGMGGAGVRFG
jgi:hypothetical protein